MSTDPARWEQLEALLPDALDRPDAERAAFLDAACVAPDGRVDAALRDEVGRLLAALADADASGALVSPFDGLDWAAAYAPDDAPSGGPLPERVGAWRITGLLGRGGMGVVYAAERAEATFTQRAALKLVRPEVGDDFRARFVHERAVLAGLEHAHIARLLDGGVTPDGTPFLAMERVDGEPITDYADRHGLGVEARLGLFLQVCAAVGYAHRSLVVHRDLKPSNILVADGGEVKLLDFGVAKLLDPTDAEATDAETLTRTHAALTPAYAAPEQFRHERVTTATDVYALGVVLYELLAGVRPYALSGTTAAEAERIVCETVPPPPSAVAPPDRARALRGDLDTIVRKALAKEPARRYASAEAFADDVRRHRDGLPVQARRATAGYRARRFVRRHRVGVAAAVLVGTALAAGAGVALAQARVARAEAAKAEAVNRFLVGLLGASDPTAEGRDIRVASLLDQAAATLDSVFAGQPDVEATMRQTLGSTYLEMGLFDEAERELRRGLSLRERLPGARHRDVVETQAALGDLWLLQDRLEPADSILTLALAASQSALDPDDPLVGTVQGTLGYLRFLQGDLDASLGFHRAYLANVRAQPTPDPTEVAAGLGNVAVVLDNQGRPAEAAALIEEQVAVYRQAFEPTNTRIARALNNLSTSHYRTGRYPDALRASEEAVAIFRRALGGDNAELASALSNLAPVLLALDRPADAEAALREALTLYGASLGPEHPRYAMALVKLGQSVRGEGRAPEAEAALRRAVAILRRAVPATHPSLGHALAALGEHLGATGRAQGAVPVLREALAIRREALPPDHPDRWVAASLLGDALRQTGQTDEAARLLAASHAALARAADAAPTDAALADRRADAARRLAARRPSRSASR